ncbi:flagellar type III secretion system protein FlhB [Paracoccus jeotgali]|uniref:Flagellar biosynthesis protein FlhB n=1 Tax=Paracoccus jeotgali TaxID=2065379 RepID=A0A2K9MGN8_9RHOB|nr:flagellar type III secretion system protein FlhB [Paracoccus jeotgali]AUM74783.1 flagellar biosynthesis protein FlhB [Paracoccus jeotgali]
MSDEDQSDKQFDATEQKLRKAREKGDFPRSTEVNAALVYLGAMAAGPVALWWAVPAWLSRQEMAWAGIGQRSSGSGGSVRFDGVQGVWGSAAVWTLVVAALPAAILLVGLIAQRGIVFVPSKLAIDINRINPIKNAGQKFGKSGLVGFGISASKAVAVGVGGWLLFRSLIPVMTADRAGIAWVSGLSWVVWRALILALIISILFAAADLGWKHFDFRRRNRMSLKELKDEMKDSEGDPHMKSARRQKSMDIVLSSMLAEVEKADVVIVNPTHYAVALAWKRGSGRAPVCVAKGVDEVALRIRERASAHNVPIWPDPPCARAIHATIRVGDEIATEHFAPVAAAIRFAEAMRAKVKRGW